MISQYILSEKINNGDVERSGNEAGSQQTNSRKVWTATEEGARTLKILQKISGYMRACIENLLSQIILETPGRKKGEKKEEKAGRNHKVMSTSGNKEENQETLQRRHLEIKLCQWGEKIKV